MIVDKQRMLKALEIVKPGLANTELIEQSASFAFLEGKVVTFNDTISLSHPVPELELEGAIRADELYNFIKRVKKKDIEMELGKNEIKLKAGNSRVGIRLAAEITLPIHETQDIKEWYDLPDEFADDLDFVKESAGKDMSRRILTCVHVQETSIEASDSLQVMRSHFEGDATFPFGSVLIPAEVIPEIVKIYPTMVAQTDGWLHFKNADETQISVRILMDEFPETRAIFDMGKSKEVSFPKTMDAILDRVMVFTRKESLMEEEMRVLLKNNVLTVTGKNEFGWIKERAKIAYDGKAVSFWINPHLLKKILDRSNTCMLGEDRIKFNGPDEMWEYVAILRVPEKD